MRLSRHQMPEIDGFELLSRSSRTVRNLHHRYDGTPCGIETNSVDYLLKPIEQPRLIRALDKLEGRCSNSALHSAPAVDELVPPDHRRLESKPASGVDPSRRRISLIEVDRVTHFVSEDRYSYACTDEPVSC